MVPSVPALTSDAAPIVMLTPQKNQIAIYELHFMEGAMAGKKGVHTPRHPELADKNVPNLPIMKVIQYLKS